MHPMEIGVDQSESEALAAREAYPDKACLDAVNLDEVTKAPTEGKVEEEVKAGTDRTITITTGMAKIRKDQIGIGV